MNLFSTKNEKEEMDSTEKNEFKVCKINSSEKTEYDLEKKNSLNISKLFKKPYSPIKSQKNMNIGEIKNYGNTIDKKVNSEELNKSFKNFYSPFRNKIIIDENESNSNESSFCEEPNKSIQNGCNSSLNSMGEVVI